MKTVLLSLVFISLNFLSFSQDYKVGEQIMGFEDDDELWYKATVLELGDGGCKIHWEGFDSQYDEFKKYINLWKPGIDFLERDELQGLETDGKWYNVKVKEVDNANDKYFIHWGGFDSKYDRWISADSLRLPTKENYIAEGNFKTSSSSSAYGDSRIGIVYLENKTGATIKYTYSGDGSSGGGTIYNNQKDNIKNAPVGGELKVNGSFYMTISRSHDGQTIVIK